MLQLTLGNRVVYILALVAISSVVPSLVLSGVNTRVAELWYLSFYIVKSRSLKCSLDAAKRGFYRTANSIFGKVGTSPQRRL